jgi:hypothetical protein
MILTYMGLARISKHSLYSLHECMYEETCLALRTVSNRLSRNETVQAVWQYSVQNVVRSRRRTSLWSSYIRNIHKMIWPHEERKMCVTKSALLLEVRVLVGPFSPTNSEDRWMCTLRCMPKYVVWWKTIIRTGTLHVLSLVSDRLHVPLLKTWMECLTDVIFEPW